MAVETVRRLSFMGEWLLVYITYDTADGNFTPDLEAYRVECHAPDGVGIHVRLWRSNSGATWREATLYNGDVFEDTAPFGPVRKIYDIGYELSVVYG